MRKLNVVFMKKPKEPDSEGIIDGFEYGNISIERSFSKLYASGILKLTSLKGSPVNLFLYFMSNCDEHGMVSTDQEMVRRFIKWVKTDYSDASVKWAIKELKKNQLIIPVNKGRIQLNPIHFWNGPNEKGRIEAVKKLMESGYKEE